MITNSGLQWTITVLFAITGGYSLFRLAIAKSGVDRTSNVLHVVMSLAMLSMPWSWGMVVPMFVHIAVFGLATLWYAALAIAKPDAEAGPGDGHHSSRSLLGYHAFMMASMVWMAVEMDQAMAAMHSTMEMPGMDMSGTEMPGMDMSAGADWSSWAGPLSIALAVIFVAAAIWLAVRAVAGVFRPAAGGKVYSVGDPAFSALMAAGMALYFFVS